MFKIFTRSSRFGRFGVQSDSPMAARESRRDRRRLWVLGSSLLLHAAVFGTLVGIQAWRVEAVAEPPANDVFQVLLPTPMPAEAARPAAGRRQPEAARQAATAPRTPAATPVQPRTSDVPLPPPLLQSKETTEAPPAADLMGRTQRDRGRGNGDGDGDGNDDGNGGPGDGAAGESGDGKPLPIGGPISRPQIVPGTKVQPIYTELARQAHLQGSVILQATIDEGGNVIDLRVLKALPMGLDREALRAVSQWKFTPALLHGRPVKVFFTVTVQYEAR